MLKRPTLNSLMLVLAVLLAGSAAPAWADTGFYIGAEVGRSAFDGTEVIPGGSDDPITGVDFGYYAFGGFQIMDWLGVEAGYIDFGKGHDHDANQEEFELDGMTLSAVGYIPVVPRFSVMVRAGAYSWDFVETDSGGDEEADGTDLILGLGARVKVLGGLNVRAEWTFLSEIGEAGDELPGEADVTGFFAGVSYVF
jgi:OOP family OmpA-OmpF porin